MSLWSSFACADHAAFVSNAASAVQEECCASDEWMTGDTDEYQCDGVSSDGREIDQSDQCSECCLGCCHHLLQASEIGIGSIRFEGSFKQLVLLPYPNLVLDVLLAPPKELTHVLS